MSTHLMSAIETSEDAAPAANVPSETSVINESASPESAESPEAPENEGNVDDDVFRLKAHKRAVTEPRKPAERKRTPTRPANSETNNAEEEEEEQIPESERERRALEARIDAALAPASKKRKKLTSDDIDAFQDELIAKLSHDMREAALKDVESVEQRMPAVNKVRMLPEVVRTLQKTSLHGSILDGNMLESVRIWLEPLPDASLPSYEIQKALFSALTVLPIKPLHLRESGLGRVVLFYQRSKRPHLQVKRLAQKLIGDWTRPIIGRSDNYRDKRVQTASYDPSRTTLRPSKAAASNPGLSRAAVPTPDGISYQIAPVTNIQAHEQREASTQLRRMKTKLMQGRKGGKKSNVSVEGKDLH